MNNGNLNLNRIYEFISFYSNDLKLNKVIPIYNEYIIRCNNGNKIHIKEKNKGKFTTYCKGNVTDECIKKGKNSPNSTIRKRAVFAYNAKNWDS